MVVVSSYSDISDVMGDVDIWGSILGGLSNEGFGSGRGLSDR